MDEKNNNVQASSANVLIHEPGQKQHTTSELLI